MANRRGSLSRQAISLLLHYPIVASLIPLPDALLSAEEIYEVYQEDIDETVLYALEEGDRSSAFVQVNDTWLLADMLAEVHVGHLNLAEAMIEVEGQPMGAEELLPELGLDENVSIPMRLISLNHGLAQDKRFDQIYHQGRATWFLKRLEIAEVAKTPALLRYTEMVGEVFESMGWGSSAYRGFRTEIDYPIYGSQVTMSFDPDGSGEG